MGDVAWGLRRQEQREAWRLGLVGRKYRVMPRRGWMRARAGRQERTIPRVSVTSLRSGAHGGEEHDLPDGGVYGFVGGLDALGASRQASVAASRRRAARRASRGSQ